MTLIYEFFLMFSLESLFSFSKSMQTGVILTKEYLGLNRLDFLNYVKIHVIIMFSDQQFVDIN